MKFIVKNSKISVNHLIRKIGYRFLAEMPEGDLNLVRPIDRNHYPRFHIYLKINKTTNELIFNLHLDQRKPVYQGATAHSGEYNGKIVEEEAERIKKSLL